MTEKEFSILDECPLFVRLEGNRFLLDVMDLDNNKMVTLRLTPRDAINLGSHLLNLGRKMMEEKQ